MSRPGDHKVEVFASEQQAAAVGAKEDYSKKYAEFLEVVNKYNTALVSGNEFAIEDYKKIKETIQQFAVGAFRKYKDFIDQSTRKDNPAFIDYRANVYDEYLFLNKQLSSLMDASKRTSYTKSWLMLSDIGQTPEFLETQNICGAVEIEKQGQFVLSDSKGGSAIASPAVKSKYSTIEAEFQLVGTAATQKAKNAKQLVAAFEESIVVVLSTFPAYKAPAKESKAKSKTAAPEQDDEEEFNTMLKAAKESEVLPLRKMLETEKADRLKRNEESVSLDRFEKLKAEEAIESYFAAQESAIDRLVESEVAQVKDSRRMKALDAEYQASKNSEAEINYLTHKLEGWAKALKMAGYGSIEKLLQKPEYLALKESVAAAALQEYRGHSYNEARLLSSSSLELANYLIVLRHDYGWLESSLSAIEAEINPKIKKEKIKAVVDRIEAFKNKEVRKYESEVEALILKGFPADENSRKILLQKASRISQRMKYLAEKVAGAKSILEETHSDKAGKKAIEESAKNCDAAILSFQKLKDKVDTLSHPNAALIFKFLAIPEIAFAILSGEKSGDKKKSARSAEGQKIIYETLGKIFGDKEIDLEEVPYFVIHKYILSGKRASFNEAGGLKAEAGLARKDRQAKLLRDDAEFESRREVESKKSPDGQVVKITNTAILVQLKKSNDDIEKKASASSKPYVKGFVDNIVAMCDYFKAIAKDGEIRKLLTTDDRKERADRKEAKKEAAYPAKYPVKGGGKKEWIVGDIHGDLNSTLTAIITSGLAHFKEGEDSFAIYDIILGRKVTEYPPDLTNEQFWARYRVIPNLEFNKDFQDQFISLGDILDRGAYSDECLYTLLDLCRQEKALFAGGKKDQKKEEGAPEPESEYMKKRKFIIVFADHELYGVCKETTFVPSYLKFPQDHPSPITALGRGPDKGLQAVSFALRSAMKDDLIVYGHVGTDGVTYTHSFYTKECFEAMLKEVTSESAEPSASEKLSKAGRSPEELAKVAAALKYYLELDKLADKSKIDYAGEEHQLNSRLVIEHFNKVLKFTATHPEIYFETLYLVGEDMVDSRHPLFAFDHQSPISTRGIPLPAMMGNGHTAQKSMALRHISQAEELGEKEGGTKGIRYPIWFFDCVNSYMANPANQCSHPTVFCKKEDGTISSIRFKNETIFMGGSVNPSLKAKDPSSSPASTSLSSSQIEGDQEQGDERG